MRINLKNTNKKRQLCEQSEDEPMMTAVPGQDPVTGEYSPAKARVVARKASLSLKALDKFFQDFYEARGLKPGGVHSPKAYMNALKEATEPKGLDSAEAIKKAAETGKPVRDRNGFLFDPEGNWIGDASADRASWLEISGAPGTPRGAPPLPAGKGSIPALPRTSPPPLPASEFEKLSLDQALNIYMEKTGESIAVVDKKNPQVAIEILDNGIIRNTTAYNLNLKKKYLPDLQNPELEKIWKELDPSGLKLMELKNRLHADVMSALIEANTIVTQQGSLTRVAPDPSLGDEVRKAGIDKSILARFKNAADSIKQFPKEVMKAVRSAPSLAYWFEPEIWAIHQKEKGALKAAYLSKKAGTAKVSDVTPKLKYHGADAEETRKSLSEFDAYRNKLEAQRKTNRALEEKLKGKLEIYGTFNKETGVWELDDTWTKNDPEALKNLPPAEQKKRLKRSRKIRKDFEANKRRAAQAGAKASVADTIIQKMDAGDLPPKTWSKTGKHLVGKALKGAFKKLLGPGLAIWAGYEIDEMREEALGLGATTVESIEAMAAQAAAEVDPTIISGIGATVGYMKDLELKLFAPCSVSKSELEILGIQTMKEWFAYNLQRSGGKTTGCDGEDRRRRRLKWCKEQNEPEEGDVDSCQTLESIARREGHDSVEDYMRALDVERKAIADDAEGRASGRLVNPGRQYENKQPNKLKIVIKG